MTVNLSPSASLALDSSTSLAAWLKHLENLHPCEIDLGLARVRAVAQRLKLPLLFEARQQGLSKVITFSGTNGKGSTLALTESMALAQGLTVGSYTSPHFLHFNERIKLNGQPVSDTTLTTAFLRIETARVTPAAEPISLSYFEFATLAGLLIFQDAAVDLWLLEVGLGGRLDAVNIVDADVAVLVTVAQDHMNYLGADLNIIGQEKAGIFRKSRPVVLGSLNLPNSVYLAAEALDCQVFQLWEAFQRTVNTEGNWAWQGIGATINLGVEEQTSVYFSDLPSNPLPPDNAATAIQALLLVCPNLTEQAIKNGLATARLTGRMQREGQWLLDVAHNPEAASYLAARLAEQGKKKRLALVGMMADKDIHATLLPLLPWVDAWIVTSLPLSRAAKADKLAALLESLGAQVMVTDLNDQGDLAFSTAQQALQVDYDEVLVMGSFFTLAQVLLQLKHTAVE
ncbi:MAG TPA: folylpolyglutamate synthase/dihydrofolate synthase family protein [Marinospirillum sp.]|uniref:bifunctional folylpolyglutamate synthase/dihydrofolate synthase n=1 Tax=Marinospirillum sp. TaxID=2183934 RepID=UPI002B4A5B2D|nr:folylpolyglutamate synthase/dihydrofolate synthase family protein [Marinospirillum sp.]HKM15128.1 folylpolyglutamate synthase/dihydrofolate synthase family protein [Marinospirillum sp.]